MKNKFEDILNGKKGEEAVEKYLNRNPEETSSSDALPKVLQPLNPADDVIQQYLSSKQDVEIKHQEEKVEQNVTEESQEDSSPSIFSVEIPLDEEEPQPKIEETVESKEAPSSEVKDDSGKVNQSSSGKKKPIVLRKPKVQPVVVSDSGTKLNPTEIPPMQVDVNGNFDNNESVSRLVHSSQKDDAPKEEKVKHSNPSEDSQPSSTTSSEKKKNSSQSNVKKERPSVIQSVLSFLDYKKVMTVAVGAMFITFGIAMYTSLKSDRPFVNDQNVVDEKVEALIDFTRDPQFKSNDIEKSEYDLEMERAVNEGKPANYYVLQSQYPELVKDTDYSKFAKQENTVMLDSLFLSLNPDSVDTIMVDKREVPLNGAVTAWAIQTNSLASKSKVKTNIDSITVAVEAAFYNKDFDSFKDKEANESVVSFVVERIIGEPVKVERVLLKSKI